MFKFLFMYWAWPGSYHVNGPSLILWAFSDSCTHINPSQPPEWRIIVVLCCGPKSSSWATCWSCFVTTNTKPQAGSTLATVPWTHTIRSWLLERVTTSVATVGSCHVLSVPLFNEIDAVYVFFFLFFFMNNGMNFI